MSATTKPAPKRCACLACTYGATGQCLVRNPPEPIDLPALAKVLAKQGDEQ
jgi:hypothetical protein